MEKQRRITRENAKKIAVRTGSGAKNIAVKTGSGAKRIASAPGKKVKARMDNLNERMVAVSWTPKKMLKEYLGFNVTGCFNTAFAFVLYELFYWMNLWPEHRAVAAWVVSVLIGQVESHYAHYRFTFKSGQSYLESLKWGMIIYTTILIFSTTSEYILVEKMLIYHRFAWAINTVLFGFVNFAFLRWLAYPPEFDKSLIAQFEEE